MADRRQFITVFRQALRGLHYGAPILASITATSLQAQGQGYVFERLWPQLQQPHYLYLPSAVAVNAAGDVILADGGNSRIQVFKSGGDLLRRWGSSRTGDGKFIGPDEVAVDSADNTIVADTWNARIQVFNSNGDFIRKWGSQGFFDGQFDEPYDLAADVAGNLMVADRNSSRIQVFSPNGIFL